MEELRSEITQYLPKLVNGIKDMNTNFHAGNASLGMDNLQLIIDGIDWSMKAYAGLSCEDSEGISLDLNTVLEKINTALVIKDYILVADLFEYEMIAILDRMLMDCKGKLFQ